MDSLMAALVAALLIRVTDPSAEMVAIAAERSRKASLVVLGVVIALVITQALAAVGGLLIASHLNPHAARLLFALALLMAGGGAIWPRKPVKPIESGHPFVAISSKLIASGVGDRTMFATFAVAAGGVPALAGIGGAIGGMAVLTAAAIAGETLWRERQRPAIDMTSGIVLLITGAWLGASALRLV